MLNRASFPGIFSFETNKNMTSLSKLGTDVVTSLREDTLALISVQANGTMPVHT